MTERTPQKELAWTYVNEDGSEGKFVFPPNARITIKYAGADNNGSPVLFTGTLEDYWRVTERFYEPRQYIIGATAQDLDYVDFSNPNHAERIVGLGLKAEIPANPPTKYDVASNDFKQAWVMLGQDVYESLPTPKNSGKADFYLKWGQIVLMVGAFGAIALTAFTEIL